MSLPRPFRAVLFDLDGTLLDTERLYVAGIRAACADLGWEAPVAFFHGMLGRPWPHCYEMMAERFGADFDQSRFDARFGPRFDALLAAGVPVKPGARDLLDGLSARAIPMAVATSTWRDTAERHLRAAGLFHYFQAIVTRDMVERGKPAPDTFLKAAESLGAPPEHCLAIEDSPAGVRAAAAAGAMTLMIPDLVPATETEAGLCLAVLESLTQVLEFVNAGARQSGA